MSCWLKQRYASAPLVLPFALSLSVGASAAVLQHRPVSVGLAVHVPMLPNGSKPVNWPQLGFDSGHSGYNKYEKTIGPNNVSHLQQAWSFSTGSGNTAGNVVYVDGVVYAASANGTLFALDASTGSQLWSFASGTGHQSSGSTPAVDKGLVFSVCNLAGGAQGLCALSAATGTVSWSYAVPGSTSYAGTPPVFLDGSVYFEACGLSCSYVALDEKTGTVRWSVSEQASCEANNGVTPSVANGLLYAGFFGCSQATICALSVADGSQAFCGARIYELEGLSVGKKLGFALSFTGTTEELIKFGAKDSGASLYTGWGASTPWTSMPALVKGVVFLQVAGSGVGAYKAKAKYPGKLIWGQGLSAYSWPSIVNDVAYAACPGHPCALNASSGVKLWEGSGTASFGVRIVVNGTLYGACNGSNVCAYTLPGSRTRRR